MPSNPGRLCGTPRLRHQPAHRGRTLWTEVWNKARRIGAGGNLSLKQVQTLEDRLKVYSRSPTATTNHADIRRPGNCPSGMLELAQAALDLMELRLERLI
jgi:hypothetical protein